MTNYSRIEGWSELVRDNETKPFVMLNYENKLGRKQNYNWNLV
jgi:hypothetical protein